MKFAVIGGPALRISRSPEVHGKFGVQCDIPVSVELKPTDGEEAFHKTMLELKAKGFVGISIAQPFKEYAFKFCDRVTVRAKYAGAVNAIKIASNGSFVGDNTDGIGLVNDIKKHFKFSIKDKSVLIIGAGGVAHGALQPIFEESPKSVSLVNRTLKRAEALAQRFKDGESADVPISVLSFDFEEIDEPFDLILNTTSASLDKALPGTLPDKIISSKTLCYDVVFYEKNLTVFEEWARQHGARFANGIGMGIEQGAVAFLLWTGMYPNTVEVMNTFLYHRDVQHRRMHSFFFPPCDHPERKLVRSAYIEGRHNSDEAQRAYDKHYGIIPYPK